MKCDHMGDPAIRSHQFASVRNDPSPRQKRDRLSHQLVQTKKAAYPRKGFGTIPPPGKRGIDYPITSGFGTIPPPGKRGIDYPISSSKRKKPPTPGKG